MAVLSGQSVRPIQGGIDNPNLTTDHWAFAWVNQFDPSPYVSDTQRTDQAPLTTHWPVAANGRGLSGQRRRAHVDDWYHRIHISPQQLDLGNVVSAQASPVFLWNAFLEPRTLSSITGLDEGIEISGQPAPPLLFPALMELAWNVTVTPDGQPVLDTVVAWQFDNDHSVGLRITANRIIAWAFVPDWGDGIRERLSASTDILQSESAASQRRQLRLAPRREFTGPMYAEGRERQLLDLALFGWSDRVWSMPIWPDIQLLEVGIAADVDFIPCSTQYLDFRNGGLAMLRGEDAFTSETVEILEVLPNGLQLKRNTQLAWAAGSRLYPARAAQLLDEPSLSKLTDRLIEATVQFLVVEECEWPEWLPAVLYRGRPVWDRRPDDTDNLTHSAERLRSTLDSGFAQPLITDTARRALQMLGQRHLDLGREARALVRSFIYGMRGRQKVVWVPSHMDDLTLVATISAVATTLDIENIGYTRFSNGKPGRRDIRIELFDGSVFMRRLIGSTELDSQVERVGLDSALGVEVQPHHVARISWMNLMRFESDVQEIEHMTDSEGVAAWATVFREERDDEF
ncbi:TPA: hypothetical protein L4718_002516 [Pseudomonas aeruginosa]|nr:hypothetical protein [Pseudomonas aeruginosa]HBO5782044.1 hypothetical protein [Pseudomonas aeruginosa]HBO6016732.1 hypothetical protein [Pseudomonas aeruginosa]HBO6023215.1 hypothetical protein [Pseudomonas aeruginosa]HBO6029858.1 hypothetical protein [Pseudomonas aeruginosa]